MLSLAGDWKSYLLDAQRQSIEAFVNHERTGRSLGKDRFIVMAESNLTRDLIKKSQDQKYLMIIKHCTPKTAQIKLYSSPAPPLDLVPPGRSSRCIPAPSSRLVLIRSALPGTYSDKTEKP